MSADHIRYDLLTQDALRGVIRAVLTDVAVRGLPGSHHFYITFDTRADGVRLSARLKASYPEEMTIVLQNQFWDLTVGEEDFDVGLAFGGVSERLHIPFRAVKAFMDPSVQFGLQFAVETDAPPAGAAAAEGVTETMVSADDQAGPAPRRRFPASAVPEPAAKEEGADIVRLDRFRKK